MSEVEELFFKIIILGKVGVGKTSLLQRYCKNKFSSNYKCTIGTDVLQKTLMIDDGRRKVVLQLWDTSGQERYRTFNSIYFRGSDACILLFDLNDLTTFEDIDSWRNEFLINACPLMPHKFPFILIGNKADEAYKRREVIHIYDKKGNSRQKDFFKVRSKLADEWCKKNHKVPYVEISAKDNKNVEHAFRVLLNQILNYIELTNTYEEHKRKPMNIMLRAPSEDRERSGWCCN